MRRLILIVTLVLAAVSAAGCSGSPAPASHASSGPSSASSSARPGPAPASSLPSTLAQYYAQRLDWKPCDQYFECAWLYVPFDYSRPAWRRFALPVVKLPAAGPGKRIGSLVINPGGPGGSGVQYALGARTGEFTQAVLDRFDIVGFDPRGVGGSEPAVHCMTGPQLDKYFATDDMPANATQLAAVVSESKLYASQCAKNAGPLLPYAGTANSAKDMDVLRAALGDSALTYLGKSYGTDLGASYARQFPSRVRALVLDGAVDPSLSGIQLDEAQAQGFETAFGQFAAWCVTQSGCPFGKNASAAEPAVAALLAKATAHPLSSQLGNGQPADGAMLLTGIASALYVRQEWPTLKDALTEALTSGDGTVLVELANVLTERNSNGTYSNLSDAENSVDCIDRPWPRSLSAWQQAAASAARSAPLFGASIVWGSLPCAYWQVPPAPAPAAASASASAAGKTAAAPPILVVGDLHDPATPYAWARALSRELPSGVLLGWNGEGHTSYMEGSSCIDDAVDSYLIALKTPRSGTVCP
jgi:pimeloyl-ACP methyl ester carboxylesterase